MREESNRTPLHIAVAYGNSEMVKFLLDQPGLDIRARTVSGETAFSYACHQDMPLKNIEILIANDPDLAKMESDWLQNPLQIAISHRRLDIVRFLIERCGVDPIVKDAMGDHALSDAFYWFDENIIKYLIRKTNCDL